MLSPSHPGLRRLAGCLLCLSVALGCTAERPAPAPKLAQAPASAPAAAIFPQQEGDWTVWSRGAWSGRDIRLSAVDLEQRRAVLWLSAHHPSPQLAVEVVSLADGAVIERWDASPERAAAYANRYPVFRPLTGTLEEDLRRFGSLIAPGGPWTTRARDVGPLVVPGPQAGWLVYGAPPEGGRDGEWLMVLSPAGTRRLDVGMVASYAPTWAPDGSALAFSGCSPRHAARGTNCTYQLFVAPAEGGAPVHVPIAQPHTPVWTPDGSAVLALGQRGGKTCLWRAARGDWAHPEALLCPEGLEELAFTLDPAGERAVVGGGVMGGAEQRWRYQLVDLKGGAALPSWEVAGAVGIGSLGPGGRLVVPAQGGSAAALELSSGAVQRAEESDATLVGFSAARWPGEREIVLLRRGRGRYELVSWRLR